MHVILRQNALDNLNAQLCTCLFDNITRTLANITFQNLVTIFCRPHDMVTMLVTTVTAEIVSGHRYPPENEALRDDENYAYVAAWQFNGVGEAATLHKEHLTFDNVPLATRSYK